MTNHMRENERINVCDLSKCLCNTCLEVYHLLIATAPMVSQFLTGQQGITLKVGKHSTIWWHRWCNRLSIAIQCNACPPGGRAQLMKPLQQPIARDCLLHGWLCISSVSSLHQWYFHPSRIPVFSSHTDTASWKAFRCRAMFLTLPRCRGYQPVKNLPLVTNLHWARLSPSLPTCCRIGTKTNPSLFHLLATTNHQNHLPVPTTKLPQSDQCTYM